MSGKQAINMMTSENLEFKGNLSKLELMTNAGKSISKTNSLVAEDSVYNDSNDICITISAWNNCKCAEIFFDCKLCKLEDSECLIAK